MHELFWLFFYVTRGWARLLARLLPYNTVKEHPGCDSRRLD